MAASAHGTAERTDHRGAGAGAMIGVEVEARVIRPGSRRALANSAAEVNRSAGSLASAVSTASSTAAGTVSRTREGAIGFSVIILATIACAVLPVKGGSPVSIS
jgi:hypothetical protein